MLIRPLSDAHDKKGFDCGNGDLNRWLCEIARQHQLKRISSTFVALKTPESSEIVGFYSLSLSEIVNVDLPPELKKRLPVRVPVFRLGRLAVSIQNQRQGIGEFLLFDAIDRATRVAGELGGVGIIVDAKDSAIEFYRSYGFIELPDRPLNLFLKFN